MNTKMNELVENQKDQMDRMRELMNETKNEPTSKSKR